MSSSLPSSSYPFGSSSSSSRADAQAILSQLQRERNAATALPPGLLSDMFLSATNAQQQRAETAELLRMRKTMLLGDLSASSPYGGGHGLSHNDLTVRQAIAGSHPSLMQSAAHHQRATNTSAFLERLALERAAQHMAAVGGHTPSAADSILHYHQQSAATSTPTIAERLAALDRELAGAASLRVQQQQELLRSLPQHQAAAASRAALHAVNATAFPEVSTSQGNSGPDIRSITCFVSEKEKLAAAEQAATGGVPQRHVVQTKAKASAKKTSPKKAAKVKPAARGRKGKKSYKRKKPQDMPRRPLSAYNLFFSAERERILKEIDAKEKLKGEEQQAATAGQSEGPDGPDPDALLRPMVVEKPRVHKKIHGKIGFRELAKMVGERWGVLDAGKRAEYQELAFQDSQRHKVAMEQYYKKKHDQRMALLTTEYAEAANQEYSS